jgi:hypothetical protein
MNPPVRPPGAWTGPLLFLLAAIAVPGWPALERALFKDIPSTDAAREVVQTVLGSRFYSMRDGFSSREWAGSGYRDAWDRAKRYFPGQTYLVRPGTHFMAHGFDAEGRLFMEVHESAYLRLCVENRRTFTSGAIVEEYGRMLGAPNGLEAAAFREKVGRLEPSFRDGKARQSLRQALGRDLYARLLEGLRREDYHMIAGGLMHEGMHAGLDDALVARIQAEFKAGRRAVQWDELRAFAAEIGYHMSYGRWASGEVAGDWRRAEASIAGLERFRKSPALRPGPDEIQFERIRAHAWAFAALIRLRMREIWQSARRARDLAVAFRKDYVRAALPPDVEGLLAGLDRETAGSVAAAGEAIQATELAVRSLEDVLDVWGEWADGRRPFPPPVTDSQAVVRQGKEIRWPEPATDPAALIRKASEALEKERTPA